MRDFRGISALVTGASSGIGRATALALASRGARVALLARSGEALAKLAAEIEAGGGEALVLPCDVTDAGQVERSCAAALEAWSRIELLVNNAGYGVYLPLQETPLSDIEGMIAVNYLGTVHVTRALLPQMLARRAGQIINVASGSGYVALPSFAAYSASKHAVVGFSEGLHHDLGPLGITINLVNPGPVSTAFLEHPSFAAAPAIARFAIAPERVARAIIATVGSRRFARFVPWYLGPLLWLRSLLPGLSRRVLAWLARPRRQRRPD